MQNILLTLQYDGTRYSGWQRPEKDKGTKTISYKITEILKKMTGEEILLFPGAKTEANVHASGQIASFSTSSSHTPEEFLTYLNRYLPQDIVVLSAVPVSDRFRADLNAISRTYEYRICTSRVYDLFSAKYEAHMYPTPDVSLMREAARHMEGTHDFRLFSAAGKKKSAVRTISECSVVENNGEIKIRITANDFLNRMPGNLIETLLLAGTGQLDPPTLPSMLAPASGESREKKADKKITAGASGRLFTARGLTLTEILYQTPTA